ncbi:hypothetical protein M9458_052684, partial [Cirrhinus mrigala]
FCHRPTKQASNCAAYSGMVCYDFYKRSGVRCSYTGRKISRKNPIDNALRPTLTGRSAEREFRRNMRFTTFGEAGRL